jgi:hypothetical protein
MFKKFGSAIAAGFVGVVATAGSAMADPSWYDSISVSADPATTVFAGIAGALATIWAVRKVINMINKS